MTYTLHLNRRPVRFRASLIALAAISFAACDTADQITSSTPAEEPGGAGSTDQPVVTASPSIPAFSAGFGGIPFGTFAQPLYAFDRVLNGSKVNIGPDQMLKTLAAIKARGGRVVLALAGHESYYKDAQGHFSFSMWKQRINRYKGVNLSSYVSDGTVIGHYMIDEPNDPYNWNGEPIPGSMLEEMAKYSKSLWPTMNTIVRAHPTYMDNFSTTYHYLDAAWAQYAERFGDPRAYLAANIAAAKSKGLALVVGLNISMGTLKKTELSPQQIESWGSALLSDSYPCAFISWQYRETYLSRPEIRTAMSYLAQKARSHAARACGSGATVLPPPDEPAPSLPGVSGIVLTATKVVVAGEQQIVLRWSGATGDRVDLYRNKVLRRITPNDGIAVSVPKRDGLHTFKICLRGTTTCSNNASA